MTRLDRQRNRAAGGERPDPIIRPYGGGLIRVAESKSADARYG